MHALLQWLKSGDWKLTFEGVATFATAVFALVAAWIAYRGVQKQIAAEKKARRDERDQRIKSLAVALRVEIEDFRDHHVKPFLDRKDGQRNDENQNMVKLLDLSPLTISQANAAMIGELGEEAARSVVHFRNLASEHLAAIRRYVETAERPAAKLTAEKEERDPQFFKNKVVKPLGPLKEAAKAAIDGLQEIISAKRTEG